MERFKSFLRDIRKLQVSRAFISSTGNFQSPNKLAKMNYRPIFLFELGASISFRWCLKNPFKIVNNACEVQAFSNLYILFFGLPFCQTKLVESYVESPWLIMNHFLASTEFFLILYSDQRELNFVGFDAAHQLFLKTYLTPVKVFTDVVASDRTSFQAQFRNSL